MPSAAVYSELTTSKDDTAPHTQNDPGWRRVQLTVISVGMQPGCLGAESFLLCTCTHGDASQQGKPLSLSPHSGAGSQALPYPVVQPCNTSRQTRLPSPTGTALCHQPAATLCSQVPACQHRWRQVCEWPRGSKLCLLPPGQPAPGVPKAAPSNVFCCSLQAVSLEAESMEDAFA